MTIEYALTFLFADAIQTYILYRLLSGVFFVERKVSKKFEFIAYVLAFAINNFSYIVIANSIVNFIFSTLIIILLTFCYKSKLAYRFLVGISTLALFAFIELLVVYFVDNFLFQPIKVDLIKAEYSTLINLVFVIFLKFFIVYILVKRKRYRGFSMIPHRYIWLLPLTISSSLTFLLLFQLGSLNSKQLATTVIFLFLVNIFCFEIFDRFRKKISNEAKGELLHYNNSHNRLHHENLREQMLAEKLHRHDLKDHLLLLKASSKEKKVTTLIDRLLEENQKKYHPIKTENKAIDDILSLKINLALVYQIRYQIVVQIPKLLDLDESTLVTLIGIIWDISLEQAKYSRENYIYFELSLQQNVLLIKTRSSMNRSEGEKNLKGKILCAESLLSQYNGNLTTTILDNNLLLIVSIPYCFSNEVTRLEIISF